jgi:hypothetical protein
MGVAGRVARLFRVVDGGTKASFSPGRSAGVPSSSVLGRSERRKEEQSIRGKTQSGRIYSPPHALHALCSCSCACGEAKIFEIKWPFPFSFLVVFFVQSNPSFDL